MGYDSHNTPLFLLFRLTPLPAIRYSEIPEVYSPPGDEMEGINPLSPNPGDQSTTFRASSLIV